MPQPKLFEPITVGGKTLANRIVIAPMCQYSAEDGMMNDWHLIHLGGLSQSGAGILTIEATGVLPEGQTLYDPESTTIVHHANQAMRAHKLFNRDQQYIVRDDEIVLIDEFTGRMMKGRRLSDGLHQAIEAKVDRRTAGKVVVRRMLQQDALKDFTGGQDRLRHLLLPAGKEMIEAARMDLAAREDVGDRGREIALLPEQLHRGQQNAIACVGGVHGCSFQPTRS